EHDTLTLSGGAGSENNGCGDVKLLADGEDTVFGPGGITDRQRHYNQIARAIKEQDFILYKLWR
ncbi:MAG: hypothetical protein IJ966_06160, partial [Bacilli bacterium]|nr:hypothetical protein [Bacilli bacterium]